MAVVLPFSEEPGGIVRTWHDNGDGTYTIKSVQHVETEILDRNKAMQNHNDGYTPSRDIQRVASIPKLLLEHWKYVEGWDPFHPENSNKLKQKLNSNEFMWLRTATGRL